MAVPRIGIVSVLPIIIWAAGVAMARARSTFWAIKLSAMVASVLLSALAFCWSSRMFSPSTKPLSFRASTKPWLARSSASCCTNCTTPITGTFSSARAIPGRNREIAIMAASTKLIFFMVGFSFFCWVLLKINRPLQRRGREDPRYHLNLPSQRTASRAKSPAL